MGGVEPVDDRPSAEMADRVAALLERERHRVIVGDGPPRPHPAVVAAVAAVVALVVGAGSFVAVRTALAPDPVVATAPTPFAPPDPRPAPRPTAAPAPTRGTASPGPRPNPTPTPSATPTEPTVAGSPPAVAPLRPGNPAGSGCTPGPGPLPDGQWVVYVAGSAGTVASVDLVCFDSGTGRVTNDNPALRQMPVAAGADVRCFDRPCRIGEVHPSLLAVLTVEGGAAVAVHVGVEVQG